MRADFSPCHYLLTIQCNDCSHSLHAASDIVSNPGGLSRLYANTVTLYKDVEILLAMGVLEPISHGYPGIALCVCVCACVFVAI